jgi:putative membrane-bound dehydrogenase-like protein
VLPLRLTTLSFTLTYILACSLPTAGIADEFRAGAYAKNIDPKTFPVWVNGGIAGHQVDRVKDALFARCLVMSQGKTKLAIAIVDNCILPHEITDRVKAIVEQKIGIPPTNILIAATHTHSAVSVTGTHGCPVQEDYAQQLPEWIAEGIIEAHQRLKPARVGTTSVVAEKYIYCRDWLMKPGTANSIPFSGRTSDDAAMNPGYGNENKLAPLGPIDRLIPILSIQDLESKPLAVLASFSTHYAGAPALSSDYFGVVCNRLAKELRPDAPQEFVGFMANATSGNANCVDFSKPREPFTHVDVGNYVADRILSAIPQVQYSVPDSLDVAFDSFDAKVRMPSSKEVAEAKQWIEKNLQDRLPKNTQENYARETVLLSELPPTRRFNVQAFRIGDSVIAANPCESYCESGLKIRQSSPFAWTMNIGLANGHCGYIPPPEMFQLGGYTTWRCRTSCLEEFAEPKMVDAIGRLLSSLGQRRPAKPVATNSQSSLRSPLTPRESLNTFELEEGFEIQLVAAEPQVIDPISIQIDKQQRIWAVEMRDYPSGSMEPRSRVVILRDLDKDGYYETSSVFADKLRFATGVQPWLDGALVTVEGKLVFLRDTDGDLRADREEVWLEGFSAGNPQLRANHPTITSDGWLTIASGLRGGKVSGSQGTRWADQSIDLTGSDLRAHLFRRELQAISGPSQFGLAFDDVGRRYGCSNRVPCFEVLAEKNDINLSPLAGFASPIRNALPSEADSRVYPLVDAWTTSNLHAGQFTAACGVCVTHSSIFGHTDTTTVLTCEPTGGLVQRKQISRTRGFASETADSTSAPGKEWLASRDTWFRPVDLYEGPGGDIYVVDMYRAVIEHPDWVPAELKNRPDQRFGDEHGRIYRVTAKKSAASPSSEKNAINTTKDDASAWAKRQNMLQQLESLFLSTASQPNSSRNPQKVLQWRESLKASAAKENRADVQQYAGLLAAVDSLTLADLEIILQSNNQEIQWVGLRLAPSFQKEPITDVAFQSKLASLLRSDDLDISRQSAWFLAHCIDRGLLTLSEQLKDACVYALQTHPNDPHTWMAVSAAAKNQLPILTKEFLKIAAQQRSGERWGTVALDAVEKLNQVASNSNDSDSNQIIELAYSVLANPAAPSDGAGIALRVLCGYASKTKIDDSLRQRIVDSTIRIYDSNKDPESTVAAIRLLGSEWGRDIPDSMARLITALSSNSPATVRAAVQSLGRNESDEFDRWLLDHFVSSPNTLRSLLFDTIRNRPTRLAKLIDALESGAIPLRILDAAQVQSLRRITDKPLAERVGKLLAATINLNRSKVIESYSQSMRGLTIGIDPNRGKELFAKNCSNCHRLDGVGTAVGPDISDSRTQSYDQLLIAILDPNRAIDANYFRYLALTDDGETIEGLLKDSNAQSITLEGQNGTRRVLDRASLQEFKSSGLSLMPEGIEAQLPPTDLAELLWYIKNWRYVTSNIPAVAQLPQ